MSTTTALTTTCTALDTAIVEYMDMLSAYRARRQELSRQMHSGFFSLTQAKHIMGASSLSRMQYDSRMQASATVASHPDSIPGLVLTVVPFPPPRPPSPTESEDEMDEGLDDAHTAMHKMGGQFRHRPSIDALLSTPLPGSSYSGAGGGGGGGDGSIRLPRVRKPLEPMERDPLTWFGVLVPPALRSSQSDFRLGLKAIVDLADLWRRLLDKEKDIARMYDQKRSLLLAPSSSS